jgi:gluconate:H+ symporter, GntP family
MTALDLRLVLAAVLGIGVAVALILKGRLHPFVALLCGAFVVGTVAGQAPVETAKAIQKGVGDILGGTGLIVALGLSLGAMLQLSGGAHRLARDVLGRTGPRAAPWTSLLAAMLIGLPLFFETGLVLIMPVIAAAVAALPAAGEGGAGRSKLRLMLPALAGLSVVHALVPPHPGPLLAIGALGADLGRTMLYGLLVAIPTAAVAGPLLSPLLSRGVRAVDGVPVEEPSRAVRPPSSLAAAAVVLLPVVLIGAGQLQAVIPLEARSSFGWLSDLSQPVLALLLSNLVALPLLFGRAMRDHALQDLLWLEPAGGILLAIGAGGGLKQALVSSGLADLLARAALHSAVSPLLLGWLAAVAVRLATGSATVATITAAGLMAKLVAAGHVSPEWMVLAIGAGSVFFSHVNDPGFWLVRGYLGVDTAGTFRTWSVLETGVSVLALLGVLGASRLI